MAALAESGPPPPQILIASLLDDYIETRSLLETKLTALEQSLGSMIGKFVSVAGYPLTIDKRLVTPICRTQKIEDTSGLHILPHAKLLTSSRKSIIVQSENVFSKNADDLTSYTFRIIDLISLSEYEA